jgi:hypothetical protein
MSASIFEARRRQVEAARRGAGGARSTSPPQRRLNQQEIYAARRQDVLRAREAQARGYLNRAQPAATNVDDADPETD